MFSTIPPQVLDVLLSSQAKLFFLSFFRVSVRDRREKAAAMTEEHVVVEEEEEEEEGESGRSTPGKVGGGGAE